MNAKSHEWAKKIIDKGFKNLIVLRRENNGEISGFKIKKEDHVQANENQNANIEQS